ncbi:MAG: hypothetical protein JW938_00525 [Candidatus Omnitrophica bacterium]|nr:hypothetical protein [Candidatus Omnitrophota bacterium]
MSLTKTKSLEKIERKLEDMHEETLRKHLLQCAKNFKTSWIELAQALHVAWKDKMYRDWGYNTFEGYTAKEIGIKKQTALKLLRSYMFLEKQETWYLTQKDGEATAEEKIPDYEAVDVLRLAKENKKVDPHEYEQLKKAVFEDGKDHREVKKDLTGLIRQREEIDPEEERRKSRLRVLRRFVGTLRSAKVEMETLKLVPKKLIDQAQDVIDKIEACMERE